MSKRDLLTRAVVKAMIIKGRQDLRSMHRNTNNAVKRNEKLLFHILKTNQSSEYGRKHHFEEIKTIEDYRKNVPLSNYSDYEPYVQRMINDEETNLLTSLPLVGYAQSSGSVGSRKFVPLTQPEVDIYKKYTVTRMLAAADEYHRRNGGKAPKPFRGFFICQAYDDVLPNGLTCSNVADVAAKQLGFIYPYILNIPFTRIFNGTEADFRYVNTRFALEDRDTMYMFCVFLKSFADIMVYLEKNWRTIVDDIEKGTISDLSKATPETIDKLMTAVRPNPERAAELRKEFEKGFDKTIIRRLWPNMSVIGGIGTSTFAPFAKIARRYIEGVPLDFSIYGASEGLFAAVDEPENPKQLMLIDSCYYEFIPLDQEDKILSINEIRTGEFYEIVITNQAGLYRYRCGDVIKVVGWMNQCPYIQFAFRKGQLLNIAGEKTTEEHMAEAIKKVAAAAGCTINDWAVYINLDTHPYCYGLMLENPDGKDLSAFEEVADKALREINVRYEYFVDRGTLGPVKLYNLKHGAQTEWMELQVSKGTPLSTVKPVRILDTDVKEEFFHSRII